MHVLSYYKIPKTHHGPKACAWNMHTQQALECDIAMSKHVRALEILENYMITSFLKDVQQNI